MLFLFLSYFFVKIHNVGVVSNFLIGLLQQLFSLSVFEDHSLHLYIIFRINFTLHCLIHAFHKLLDHIFQPHYTLIFSYTILERTVDTLDMSILAERSIVGSTHVFLVLHFLKDS